MAVVRVVMFRHARQVEDGLEFVQQVAPPPEQGLYGHWY